VSPIGFVEVLRIIHREAGQDQEYGEHEADEVEWQGDHVYPHLGTRRDDRRQR
jgi:hypothetical protein